MSRRRGLLLLAVIALAAIAGGVAVTYGAFRGTTSNPASNFNAKRVFPAQRTTYSWTIRDASGGGAETNADDPFVLAGDALTRQDATTWATTFGAKNAEWNYDGHLPAGIAVSGVNFNLKLVGVTATDNICVYVATYVNSTNTLISDHGAASAVCDATGAQRQVSLPEITTTDQLNDLTVRAYVRDATAARRTNIDLATVTATYLSKAATMNETIFQDNSGAGATNPWSLFDGADATAYTIAANVTNAFGAARYVKFKTVSDLPAGAVVTGATLTIVFRSSTNVQSCYYTEAYSNGGATLLGTHPTAAAPNCVANATAATTTASFPEVTTDTQANDLTWKVYLRNAGNRKLVFDQVKLDLSWYLD
jgi:hypothetical protein